MELRCTAKERISYNGRTYPPGFGINLPKDEAVRLARQGKVALPQGASIGPTETKPVGPTETKPEKPEEYKCQYCDRTFDTPQGKAAHERYCGGDG